ncbi:putative cysteine-rich receptor-like protein kinase 9 [Prosopis cineraria]|uniref:putative cysteine-rich receptor-like protein kinase 9 n=1 Tax=Prosopis cineraria TaxID=364024 RepID=UPI00240FA78C|nr:putative cysteine-rich receptor-like protein kinase 9 [Prosopis cineraria]
MCEWVAPIPHLIHFFYSSTTKAQTNYLLPACSNKENFTANSAFQSNLNTLLSSLASNNATNAEFFNLTVSGGGDTVYDLFMCRGDVNLQLYHQCVLNAIQRLPSECKFWKEAAIWYDECMLRYSNRVIFSTEDTSPKLSFYLWTTSNISDEVNLTSSLLTTMNEAADEAAQPALGKKKYATKEERISGSSRTLYCLVQCTPDLWPHDCRRCLGGAIQELPGCCEGMSGGMAFYPSCNVRYDSYRFYRNTQVGRTTPTPPVLSPPANNSSHPKGKKTERKKTLVPFISSGAIAVVLFI